MHIRNIAKRFGSFFVSVMPADRAFSLLLFGSTFLFISSSLGWWNGWQVDVLRASRVPSAGTARHIVSVWRQILSFAPFPLTVAGAAGFFVCFFPGRVPLRRLHLWVYFPAAVGIVLQFLLVSSGALAMQTTTNPWGTGDVFSLAGILKLAWNAGAGLHFALLGLISIALGELRLRRGLAVLPIHLKLSSQQPCDISLVQSDQPDWTKFVWFAITLMNQIGLIAGAIGAFTIGGTIDIIYLRYFHSHPIWLVRIFTLTIVPAVFLTLILFFTGKSWREILRSAFRLPFPEYFAIAFLLPIAIYSVPQIFAEIRDPSHWIALPLGAADSRLPLPLILFELFLLALVEEIAWRGYLQPRFIARFGLYRGIFFVGLVWAAFHFSGDFRANETDANVIRSLVGRMLGAVLIGFALSWLTLRSKSVLPAAVAHAAINGINRSGESAYWLALGLWALADLLLFRFWPPGEVASAPSEPLLRGINSSPS